SALADPLRRQIVLLLAAEPPGGERLCGSFGLPVTKATRTHHFRVLREAGLIFQTDLGNGRTNRLRREELEARFPGLIDLVVANG
ncbi:ArsR/SmtB family transcription factor, partial [Acinetobacter baumannii]|uniref:ArsR/SmtB family transcription factor n=1 Tax=Acinetobacter baumannii TaxID=470 RepID=UPI0013D6266C